jgi:Protein of unknown function (DUF3443)
MCVSLLLAGCGGAGGSGSTVTTGSGSGSSGSSGSGSGSSACTGSPGTSSIVSSATTAYNVVNASVDQFSSGLSVCNEAAVNIMYVNVTICAPGSTTNCQTIGHIQVDTGSQGLRILASALNSPLLSALSPVTVNGGALAECTQFVDGYSWGPIVTADLHIGGADTAATGETAPNLPMQLIGDNTYSVPAACSSGSANSTAEDTIASFGANGIIGIGLFDEDCGTGCSTSASNGFYFSCASTSDCTGAAVPTNSQMLNPVYALAANNGVTDSNGVIINLPAISPAGAATVPGNLIFGVNTQTNNVMPTSATILTTDSYYGYVSINFIGTNYPDSYLDSGSNAIYFNDSSITVCTQAAANGFFCPTSTDSLNATITGNNGAQVSPSFSIANAYALFTNNSTYSAFNDLGGSAGTDGAQSFAFGLPFFFGHPVYTVMEGMNVGGTNGPYFAF